MMKKYLFILFVVGYLPYLTAQNLPCDAVWLPQSGSINGSTPIYNGVYSGSYKSGTCNATEENPIWYKFVADANLVNFTINTSNCNGGNNGLSFAIFQPRTPNCVDLKPTPNCQKQLNNAGNEAFNATLAKNQLYYLQVDGLSGSQCDFSISYPIAQIASGFATIRGNVFLDKNSNCTLENSDLKLKDALVIIKKTATDSVFASVNENGIYEAILPLGVYELYTSVGGEKRLWETNCGAKKTINLSSANTVVTNDFFVQNTKKCAIVEVDLSSRSFVAGEKSSIKVNYKNIGTDKAINAVAKLTLSPSLSMVSISKTFVKNNNVYLVNLGDIDASESGSFDVFVKNNSNTIVKQAIENSVEIIPNDICFTNTAWDGANVRLFATCSQDSIKFSGKNIGTTAMPINGIIIEDDVMMFTKKTFNTVLPSNDSLTLFTLPATGKTYRIEVDQSINFPSRSMPNITVEGCKKIGSTATISVGFFNQFPQDDADFKNDIDVREVEENANVSNIFASPKGVHNEHYILQNQDIEYLIRYKNTGIETIENLFILDTLSSNLDMSTLRIGASNYPVSFELSGKNLLQFKFSNIKLFSEIVKKDSAELFVKFRISQRKDVPIGTKINNACVIFDDNSMVATDKVFHTIGKDFLQVKVNTQETFVPNVSVNIAPNPFSENATITINGLENTENLTLKIIDLQGRAVEILKNDHNTFNLSKNNLTKGMYFYLIENQSGRVANGKIIVE